MGLGWFWFCNVGCCVAMMVGALMRVKARKRLVRSFFISFHPFFSNVGSHINRSWFGVVVCLEGHGLIETVVGVVV